MKSQSISKQDILRASRELARTEGLAAINIRSVAAACGVSIGSIYNYFDSKSSLLNAVVASIWSDIFHHWEDAFIFQDTEVCVNWIYSRLNYGANQYPDFFSLHSLDFLQEDKTEGKRMMQQIWKHILDALCSVLKRDDKIRPDAFNEELGLEKFADILFSLILSAILRKDYDSQAVVELIRKVLY